MVTDTSETSRDGGGNAGIERWLAPIGVAAIAFELFRRGLMPGVGFWDTAELQVIGPVLGTGHPTGFPAWVVLGWLAGVVLAPFGEPAFRMNLLSAILVAAAAGLTVELVRRLSASTVLGIAAGLGLATSPLAWRISAHADIHALHVALVALLLVLLLGWDRAARARPRTADRWLLAAAGVFGVSLANHQLTLLLAPAVGLFVLAVEPAILRRPRFVAACAGLVVGVAALLYLELPLRASDAFRAPLVYGQPDTLDGFLYIVLAEQFRGSIVDPFGDLPRKLGELGSLSVAQFGPLAGLLPFGFVVTALRAPRYALLSGLAVLVTVWFASSYVNADIERYYLGPLLMAWTWLAIFAAAIVEAATGIPGLIAGAGPSADRANGPAGPGDDPGDLRDSDRRAAGAPVPVAGLVATIVAAVVLVSPALLELPQRALAADESQETSAARWLDATLDTLEPDAVVVSWWSFSTTLWYGQLVERRRPDILIVDDRTRLDLALGAFTDVIDAHLGQRPVYAIRINDGERALLEAAYVIEVLPAPLTNVVRILDRRGARP